MTICEGPVVHETTASCELVRILSDVDELTIPELETVLRRALDLGRPVTVDLTRCRYIGSLGLRSLLRARSSAHCEFSALVRAESGILRLLQITGLEATLNVRIAGRESESEAPGHDGDGPYVLTLAGEWDLSRGTELLRMLQRAADRPRLVIDMSQVTCIDSSCCSLLARSRVRRLRKGHAPERLVVGKSGVREILEWCGFQDRWKFYETLDDALTECAGADNTPAIAAQ